MGQHELQYYTNLSTNVDVQDGKLKITALKKDVTHGGQTYNYTSARLKTHGLFSQTYGKIEARIKLPTGKGLWPAFWMLPENDVYGAWAASGEIDIMEARGSNPDQASGAIHYGGKWPENTYSNGDYDFHSSEFITDFHVYAVEWTHGKIQWFVDGNLYFAQQGWYSQSPGETARNPFPAPFDQDFYIRAPLNIPISR